MKIICTEKEKQTFLNAYDSDENVSCILPKLYVGCAYKYNKCSECLEEKIEWEIVKAGEA